ncbi:MAG: hypothetical protein H7836_04800 [Magnetococcus sp. YQC-3]
MAKLPAIYVSVEDNSFALPTIDTGRTVFLAIMADRGPHNRVVEINNVAQFRRMFGPPNMVKTWQGHYLAEKALQFTNKIYVVRPVLTNETNENAPEGENASIANAAIRYNPSTGIYDELAGKFIFVNEADCHDAEMAKRVYVDKNTYANLFTDADIVAGKIYIVNKADGKDRTKVGRVVEKHAYPTNNPDHYYFKLAAPYTGTSNIDVAGDLLYHGTVSDLNGNFRFTNGTSRVVGQYDQNNIDIFAGLDSLNPVWVMPTSGKIQKAVLATAIDTNAGSNSVTTLNIVSITDNVFPGGSGESFKERYFTLGDTQYCWFTWQGVGTDPALPGRTGIPIDITGLPNDGIDEIAPAIFAVLENVVTGYTVTMPTNTSIVFTKDDVGLVANSLIGANTLENYITVAHQSGADQKFELVLDSNYTGTSTTTGTWEAISSYNNDGTDDTNLIIESLNGITVSNAIYQFSPGDTGIISYLDNTLNPPTVISAGFVFTNGSNVVTCDNDKSFDQINVGDWIFKSDLHTETARQVIEKVATEVSPGTMEYKLVLDANFVGTSTSTGNYSTANKYSPINLTSHKNISDVPSSVDVDIDPDILWSFYAVGAGEWYNRLILKGSRNATLEKMYTYDVDTGTHKEGEALYPYMFMDLYVYRKNDDGTITLLEGPWPVSLVNEIPTYGNERQLVRDLSTGKELYIETVVNDRSDFIRCVDSLGTDVLMDPVLGESARLQVQTVFAVGNVTGTSTKSQSDGFPLLKGEDGLQYDAQNRLNLSSMIGEGKLEGILVKAYQGTLPSVDNTLELIVQTIYPRYQFDYIVCGGYSKNIQNAARQLADSRGDCMCLADTGNNKNASEDIAARENDYNWNTWNAMLYSQFRKRFDENTGTGKHWFTPVFHALERHLAVDNQYWIAEPVAGIEKGIISESITMNYTPSVVKMEDLMNKEINVTISEPDGRYILTQFTTYKRLSVLKRAHAVKFVHYVKKAIPPLLKDILQRKATPYWVDLVNGRINGFMQPFKAESGKWAAVSSYSVASKFDEDRSEIDVVLTIRPLRAIEAINVRIVVQ